MKQQFKYFAFISYNSKDTEWGKRLQRKLEHYRMLPATLCSKHGWEQAPIKPVFFWTFGRICNPVAVNISIFNAKMRRRQD